MCRWKSKPQHADKCSWGGTEAWLVKWCWSLCENVVIIKWGSRLQEARRQRAEKLEENSHPKTHSNLASSYRLPGCNRKYRLRNRLFISVKMLLSEWLFFCSPLCIHTWFFSVVWLNDMGNREKLPSWVNT